MHVITVALMKQGCHIKFEEQKQGGKSKVCRRDKGCLIKVDEMSIGYKKVKKGNRKSACDYSCFNGKGAHGRLENNNKKGESKV